MRFMGEVHQLILREGLENVRRMVETRAERQAVEAAGLILAEEVTRLGITHAGFAMTSLPHKRIDEPLWRRQGHRTTLLVESGRLANGGWIGVPYGSIARLILLYLQTESIRTNDPEVELGRSMHAWLSRMGISAGGKNYRLVSEQARRISACRLTFLTEIPGAELRQNGAFVQNAITLTAGADQRQRALWQDRVRLDDGFWRSLREHPVPVREEAVRAIGARSLALDVYIWLAYRLHALTRSTPVTWTALHAQFGAGFKAVRQLKPTFREALMLALAVYPEAKVDLEAGGAVLHPSAPAVPRAEARRIGLE
jgi:Plasmid encoded RepA protein